MRQRLAYLALAALLLAGCANAPSSESAPSGDALRALSAALQRTAAAGSSRLALDLHVTSPEQSLHVTGDAAYIMDPADPSSLRERVLLNVPSIGMMTGGQIEMIVGKGSVVFIRAPMLASYIPSKTPWIKLDPSSFPQRPGGLGAATSAVNPALILAAVEGAISVEAVGPDAVEGVDATRYRATVDLVKLLPSIAELAPDMPAGADMQEAKDRLKELGLEALPVDLWVDEDGYLKQMHLTFDLSTVAPDRTGSSLSITLTLSSVGEDISIEVPPPSQVSDLTELLASATSPITSLG